MKEVNLGGNTPQQNQTEEETKGFPIVTPQEQVNAESFEMKKKDKDGDWIAAVPVHVTNNGPAEAAEEQPAEQKAPKEEQPAGKAGQPKQKKAEPAQEEQPKREAPKAAPAQKAAPAPKPEQPKKRNKKRIAAIAGGTAAAVVAVFSAYVYMYTGIFPGVRTADSYKLSGMTQEEAQAYIASDVQQGVMESTLELSGKDLGTGEEKTYTIRLGDVIDTMDSTAAAQQAYQIGREGNYFQRVGTVLNSMFTHWDIAMPVTLKSGASAAEVDRIAEDLAYDPVQPNWEVDKENKVLHIDTGTEGLGFDKEAVDRAVTAQALSLDLKPYEIETYAVDQDKPDAAVIAKDVNCKPKNATVDKKDGKTVIDAVTGVEVEEAAIAKALGDASEQSYEVGVELTDAAINKTTLEKVLFRDTLATATTYYNGGQTARTTNVRLAAEHCDGLILNPGEEFSYNDAVGERTAARGFRSAIIFEEGREVDGLGGGICQTSSTIYMAVLRADLKVTERHYHMFQVSYTPVSQDATVAWGSKDFRFVNNTAYPVKLDISCGGGAITVRIIGTKANDKEVSLYARTSVGGGYKYAALYKTVTVDGKSETHKENSSSYRLK